MDNLIITRTHGAQPSAYPSWSGERNWDLYVSPYKEKPEPTNDAGTIIGDVIPGAKWTGLRELLNEWSDWRQYKYVLLTDDDLHTTSGTWSRFFDRAAKYNAKIAAPTLTEDSFFSFVFTVRNTEFIARRVSYIEMMAPCFRIDVLTELLPTFDKATDLGEGWGLDFLWARRLGHRDLFVIDETPVTHSRQSSRTREQFTAAQAELIRIAGVGFGQWPQRSYAGIEADGHEMPETDPRFFDRLMRGYTTLFARNTSGQNPIRNLRQSFIRHQGGVTPRRIFPGVRA